MDFLRVWVNDKPVGRLSRHQRGASFVYDEDVDPGDAVALSMPVRSASYDDPRRMLPAFDTNLPEGALLDRIRKALSKARDERIGPFDILEIVGGNQIGRVRVLPDGEEPERRDKVRDIDDILEQKATDAMIAEITERYALRSGVSGAMPKVLLDDVTQKNDDHQRATIQTRDFILKFDDTDYPGLSLNEYHCLQAAHAAGNEVVEARLSKDGRMLAITRFDEREDGSRLGFEDFCAMNGEVAEHKYIGSIEKTLFRTCEDFAGKGVQGRINLEQLYRQVLTSVGLRNGDAHLKNFALVFDDAANGSARLSPAYDIVTTTAYLKKDMMALNLNGTKRWPDAKALERLGARAGLKPKMARQVMIEVANGIAEHMPVMAEDLRARGHDDLAEKMVEQWTEGLGSLGYEGPKAPEIAPVMDFDPAP